MVKLPHLRFPADRRTIAFVAAYFVAFFGFWFFAPRTLPWAVLGMVVIGSLSWWCAVITHNVVHNPLWSARWANRISQCVLSLAYGFAISDYIPGHNLSHHRYLQSRRDVMRTGKMRFTWNALNFASFFFTVAPAIIVSNGRFLRTRRAGSNGFRRQRTFEVILVWTVKAIFFLIDWKRALVFLFLPHLWAVYSITSVNYLQHDGCDDQHAVNHSRNFVGRLFNWFHFNNGFHGVHHKEPGLHWSLLPAAHAEHFGPTIHPALEQPSLAVYMFRAFVYPGRRVDHEGRPLARPEAATDIDWTLKQTPGTSPSDAVTG